MRGAGSCRPHAAVRGHNAQQRPKLQGRTEALINATARGVAASIVSTGKRRATGHSTMSASAGFDDPAAPRAIKYVAGPRGEAPPRCPGQPLLVGPNALLLTRTSRLPPPGPCTGTAPPASPPCTHTAPPSARRPSRACWGPARAAATRGFARRQTR
ncbi:MAG: hypothetical protein J3K34DRAFT_444816 [Monoraphidium minutum]|nr:MAG: hypothetical protein J3K34DRAFT_444816 [Monoraphidium minutum]